MSQRGLTDNKMRYVLTILRAAAPLVAAYEQERDLNAKTQPSPGAEDDR
jgi:hypothetical protein